MVVFMFRRAVLMLGPTGTLLMLCMSSTQCGDNGFESGFLDGYCTDGCVLAGVR